MTYLPPFLARFGLDGSADEGALRRAYARELKLIDQELDPDGFQALREARDAGQGWLRYRHDDEEFDEEAGSPAADVDAQHAPGTDLPQQHAVPPVVRPGAAGLPVFEAFSAAFRGAAPDFMQIKDLLERHLDDPRLQEIEAKELFERNIAALLAGGWQPGHDALFEVATETFGWREDRRRLNGMGYDGVVIDITLSELGAFSQEKDYDQVLMLKALRELRSYAEPGGRNPAKGAANAGHLAARYPHMVEVLSSRENLESWRKRWPAVTARDSSFGPATTDKGGKGGAMPWLAFFIIIAVVRGLSSLGSPSTPSMPSTHISQMHQQGARDLIGAGTNAGSPVDVPGMPIEASAAVIAKLVKENPDATTCAQAVLIAELRRLGSLHPVAAPGAPFDRFTVTCYRLGHWPMTGDLGQALGQAMRREAAWAYPAADPAR